MALLRFSHWIKADEPLNGAPEALVVLLQESAYPSVQMKSVTARWAATVPSAAFAVLCVSDYSSRPLATNEAGPSTERDRLESAAKELKKFIDDQLSARRFQADRLVLAGFGQGGSIALHLLLQQGANCVGVLALDARFIRPISRMKRVDYKIRLIELSDRGAAHAGLRDFVEVLTGLGIDGRGIRLPGCATSEVAIRHGGAYLAELVATAQRGNRLPLDQHWHRSAARLSLLGE